MCTLWHRNPLYILWRATAAHEMRRPEHVELSERPLWFGRIVARRPKTVMLVTGLTTLTLSMLGPLLLDNNITAGTEGFEPRGSLLADRQLQNRLVDRLSHTPAARAGQLGRRRQQFQVNATTSSLHLTGARRRQQATTPMTLACADSSGNDRCVEILDVIYECTGADCHIATASFFHAICDLEDDIRALAGFGSCCERVDNVGTGGEGRHEMNECCSPRSLPRIAEMLYGVDCAAITDQQAMSTFDSIVQCGNLQGQITDDVQASACSRLGSLASTAQQVVEWGTTPSGTMSRSAFCLADGAWEDWIHDGIIKPAMENVLMPTHKRGGLQDGKLLVASWGSQRMRNQLQNEGLSGDVVLANLVGFV